MSHIRRALDALAPHRRDDWEESTICRCCNADVHPRRLGPGGYCGLCLMDAAGTPEEMEREAREADERREVYKDRHLWDYAADVARGKLSPQKAALYCYATVEEIEDAAAEIRAQDERDAQAEHEYMEATQ